MANYGIGVVIELQHKFEKKMMLKNCLEFANVAGRNLVAGYKNFYTS